MKKKNEFVYLVSSTTKSFEKDFLFKGISLNKVEDSALKVNELILLNRQIVGFSLFLFIFLLFLLKLVAGGF